MFKGRLEAFSDRVTAIIITIMVLELRVPYGNGFEELGPLLPVFRSYVLSFMYVGIGIAVAKLDLSITFAERFRHDERRVLDAAHQGAASRLRAMIAASMIFGMLPMAIGFGEAGSQSAPLGRAVIGGLLVSTFAILTVRPSINAILHARASLTSASLNPMDPASRYYEAY